MPLDFQATTLNESALKKEKETKKGGGEMLKERTCSFIWEVQYAKIDFPSYFF